ncbi:sigma-70 family RNA polymerase sigma factor [Actinophytocola sp.]|jgi:RNA polymerase sigma-70 factor (ECF subfamily)|uniref:sigma-70 family RNA polymerase sigma factor n=1 Tax=Actinophytocola sp. TaxID=1872138 RepID=UPI0039C8BA95
MARGERHLPGDDATPKEAKIAGRHDDFAHFYRNVKPGVVAFLMYQGSSPAEADDIAQEALLEVYLRWREVDHPKAYVYKCASRSRVRRIATIHEDVSEEATDGNFRSSASTDVAYWELRHDLLAAIRRLAPREAQAIAWKLAGFSVQETASMLGTSPGTVSVSRSTAIAKLTRWGIGGESND